MSPNRSIGWRFKEQGPQTSPPHERQLYLHMSHEEELEWGKEGIKTSHDIAVPLHEKWNAKWNYFDNICKILNHCKGSTEVAHTLPVVRHEPVVAEHRGGRGDRPPGVIQRYSCWNDLWRYFLGQESFGDHWNFLVQGLHYRSLFWHRDGQSFLGARVESTPLQLQGHHHLWNLIHQLAPHSRLIQIAALVEVLIWDSEQLG